MLLVRTVELRHALDANAEEPSFKLYTGAPFDKFQAVSSDDVRDIIMKSAPKSCLLDPIPTDLLQQHIDDLIDVITAIVNESLSEGKVHVSYKSAAISPLLKKPNLDQNNLKKLSACVQPPICLQSFRKDCS